MNKKILAVILVIAVVLVGVTVYFILEESEPEGMFVPEVDFNLFESVPGFVVVRVRHYDGRMIVPGIYLPYIEDETYTVYSALRMASMLSSYSGMQNIVTRGSGQMLYVIEMAGLAEREYGPASGWIFEVNGERINVGAGVFELRGGDVVVWRYTVDGR